MFNRKIGTISWKIHTPYEGMFGKAGYEKEVTGTMYIDLTDAIAHKLLELKVYGGTELKPETYLDSVTLSGGCEQRNLPSGYQQLTYLQGDGTAYIQTPVEPTTNTGMKIMFEYGTAGGSGAISGTFNGASPRKDTFFISTNSGTVDNTWAFIAQAGSTLISTNSEAPVVGKTYTANINYKNSGTYGFEGFTQQSIGTNGVLSNKVLLFARLNIANNNITASNCKIKYVEFTEGTEVTHIYIPAKFNNTLGLYDKVTGAFLTNTNASGTFTAGADVVPTPDTPVDIVCNNGAIKVSKNVFDYKYYYDNYQIYQTSSVGRCPIKLKPNTTYTISTNTEYNTISAQIFVVNGNSISWSPNTSNNGVLVNSPRTLTTDSSGYLCVGLYYKSDSAIPESDFDNGTVWVQIEEGSSATSYTPYSPTVIYTDGTQEVVTDSLGNTANAERLLAVGDYKDTQEVINGSVTKRVGIKVLDGTEEWIKATTRPNTYSSISAIPDKRIERDTGFCTHVIVSTDSTKLDNSGYLVFGATTTTTNISMPTSICTTAEGFKAWLANQYANGTPVIVVYPLATATTSTVTGQFLSKSPVTQTAGSISNLPIAITESEKTEPTPQQPLDINCNNGVLGIDGQGNITVTGTTETVEITGKNLFDYSAMGTITPNPASTATRQGIIIKGLKAGTYTFSCKATGGINISYIRLANGVRIDGSPAPNISQSPTQITLTGEMDEIRFWEPVNNIWNTLSNVQLEQGSTATTYEPYTLLGTATAENLLKVGTYQDVQSVIDGGVTRNVGVKVLDGSENWGFTGGYLILTGFDFPIPNNGGYCTHFKTVSSSTALGSLDDTMRFGYAGNIVTLFVKSTKFQNNIQFKTYLADQYNAGTPVIIVYPLATSTTETVAGQPMDIQKGNNRIEITQASMDDLELSAKYKSSQQ